MSNNIFVTLVGLSFWPARGVMSPARAACICHPASRTLQRGAGGKTLFEHQRQWFGNPLPGRTLVLATPCCGSGGCSHGKIHRGLSGKPHRNWEDLWLAKLCLKGWRCVAATKWCSKDPYFFLIWLLHMSLRRCAVVLGYLYANHVPHVPLSDPNREHFSRSGPWNRSSHESQGSKGLVCRGHFAIPPMRRSIKWFYNFLCFV